MQNKVRYPIWFALFLMAYYVTNSIYQGYLSVYFSNVLKFSDAQVGAIFAGVAIVSVITQPFWGTMGDRMKSRNALIRILCLAASALMLCILPFKNYGIIMAITCLFAAFYMSIQPMGDSIILEALQKNDQPFGPIRLIGGLSFATASMLFGRLVDKSGREVWPVYFVAGDDDPFHLRAAPHSGPSGGGRQKDEHGEPF